ncbi:hypothetical protein HHK36_024241 [Tetracentron sinense]|uniref:Glycosyltransferase N-terminal domain-containing protein n=1 Tax=Tetracentron sinense TaxID=13715 RepID=A0A834YPC9_TETSI|nr:hypothetical protein HHK36_024241 [Tetracentron sinense]
MGKQPHVLVVPYPAQGHVMPLMKMSQRLADAGVKVTFVNTEFIHAQIMAAASTEKCEEKSGSGIHLVSVPDGLEPGDYKKDPLKLMETIPRVMPCHLEDLIRKMQQSVEDHDHITCIIADITVWWALEMAEKLGIKRAAFWPAAVGVLTLILHIPKLVEAGIINSNGTPTRNEMIQLSPSMPTKSTAEFLWNFPHDPIIQKFIFAETFMANQAIKVSNWVFSNSFYDLDPYISDLIPNLIPIGPLLESNCPGQPAGSFWQEDLTCLSWLDKQPRCSVIYVAFGSTTIFNQHQFDELALGLELVGRPFLWVVRSNLIDGSTIVYPNGFRDRIAHHGEMVKWAPQQKVLAHPSIACFLTHCGWNSTMDGLCMGVPFICWPYFTDQFHNRSCICDVWNVGLGLNPDEDGTISRHEIQNKVEKLLCDEGIRLNSLRLKETARKCVSEGGSSWKNFEGFIEQIKC